MVLDGVFNHASRGFFQFNDILESGQASPWRDWFIVHAPRLNAYDHSQPPGYEAWWNMHALPKFNTDNPQVREYLMTVAEHWVRRGIDGWRLDVPEEIQTAGFWEEFRERVRAVNPEAYLVGEIWRVAPDWIGERPRFDAVMNYRFTEATLRFVGGDRIDPEVAAPVNLSLAPAFDAAQYARVITDLLAAYPEAANRANLNLLGSHDTPRVLSLVGGDVASVRLAVLLQFTFPGAPCIYYGDEIGMTGSHDPGSRAGFPWGHEGRWDVKTAEAVRSLAALRREHPALRYGTYRVAVAEGGVYAVVREHEGRRLLVAVNAAEHAVRPWTALDGGAAVRIWGDGDAVVGEGVLRLSLPARSGGVWRID